MYIFTYFYVWARMCCGMHTEMRAQFADASSLPSCGSQGLSAGCQAWPQAPLSAKFLLVDPSLSSSLPPFLWRMGLRYPRLALAMKPGLVLNFYLLASPFFPTAENDRCAAPCLMDVVLGIEPGLRACNMLGPALLLGKKRCGLTYDP